VPAAAAAVAPAVAAAAAAVAVSCPQPLTCLLPFDPTVCMFVIIIKLPQSACLCC
jgi:hypothetical protein